MAASICVGMLMFLANVMPATAAYAIDENMQEMWCSHWWCLEEHAPVSITHQRMHKLYIIY